MFEKMIVNREYLTDEHGLLELLSGKIFLLNLSNKPFAHFSFQLILIEVYGFGFLKRPHFLIFKYLIVNALLIFAGYKA